MTVRIGLGGIVHETNTYCSAPTEIEDFEILREDEIFARVAGAHSTVNGIIDAAQEFEGVVVPTILAGAQPSGTISSHAYLTMRDELCDRLAAAMPLDAVALDIHGAGVAEGVDDIEADMANRVRELVGPDVPIVAVLDLHGNISRIFADTVDLFLGYRLYPHTDGYERGHQAVSFIPSLLAGKVKPVTHVETIPMLMPAATTDPGNPAALMNEVALEISARPGMIDCHVFHGFPFVDIPLVGIHAIGIADDDRELAKASAVELARWIWERREEFRREAPSPEQAIAQALEVEGQPVVINDTADNCGGGAPGDGTHVLRAMIEAGLENACLSFIYDPVVADAAFAAGAGATIQVRLGGKTDNLHGKPLELSAYVKTLSDGEFRLRTMGQAVERLGRMARLRIGGIDVLVGSKRSQTFDPEVFLLHGIEVTRYKVVVVKSSNHFRAGFAPIAREIITADSPGLTTLRMETFPRKRAPGPLWPVDAEASY